MKLRNLLFFAAAFSQAQFAAAQDARTVVDKIYAAIGQMKSCSFVMYSRERFGTEYIEKKMSFNVHETPKKVYMKDLESGVELLYVDGWNSNKAFINPNGFPWVNVSLKITDSQVTKESHHIVTESGLAFTGQLMRATEAIIKKSNGKFEDYFVYQGETEWNGLSCYKLSIKNSGFKYISHTVAKEDDIQKICTGMCVPAYMVMEKNNIGQGTVSVGKVLTIPTSFGKEVMVFVDKKTFMPVVQMVYDEKGLYEKYEFRDLKVNPTLHVQMSLIPNALVMVFSENSL